MGNQEKPTATDSSPEERISATIPTTPSMSAGPIDEESQTSAAVNQATVGTTVDNDEQAYRDEKVPKMAYLKLFWFFFYNFGLFAWGGPVAQIALLKFQRVFSVYQILPGPEAAELCMFFGCLSAGRLGGIIAGFAFILPGFILMLVASYLYTVAGLENERFNASFKALQPIVAALILRATHKIAEHSIVRASTNKVDPFLVIAGLCTFLNCALRINIFISLGFYGVLYAFITLRFWILSATLFLLQYAGIAVYIVFKGIPSPVALGLGIAPSPSLLNLFLLGLVAGSLSFGGAYTAIPFIQVEAVLRGKWLAQNVFLDCSGIGNILPAPLSWNAFAGAVIITIGMFFPCFLFTIAGHDVLEKLVRNKILASFFDGLCGSVVGVIMVIAAQILRSSISGSQIIEDDSMRDSVERALQSGPAAAICLIALATTYKFTNKWTPLVMVATGAIAGQFVFLDVAL